MTRSEQKFQKAVRMIKDVYRTAQGSVWVNKPMAYTLYQVWKWFNENEKPRLNNDEKEQTE